MEALTSASCFLWIAVASFAVIIVIFLVVSKISMNQLPTPSEVLRNAPPSSHLKQHLRMTRNSLRRSDDVDFEMIEDVTRAVMNVMEEHLRDGSQLGMSISVYFKGHEIANVCGGLYRSLASGKFEPVTPDTLFMSYR